MARSSLCASQFENLVGEELDFLFLGFARFKFEDKICGELGAGFVFWSLVVVGAAGRRLGDVHLVVVFGIPEITPSMTRTVSSPGGGRS